MGLKVGDFFVALGFEVDDKTLKAFNDQIKTGAKTLAAMGATAAATAYAINQFVSSSVDSTVKLKNLTDQTGVASDEVQRFYNVAGRLNTEVNLDDVINAFGRLSDVIAQAKLGQGPLGEAAQLGLNNIGGMTPLEVIQKLRENYKANVAAWGNGDERVVQQLMKSIGLGPEFIQAIKATDEEYNRLWANPILDGQYRDELVRLAQAQKEFNYQWELFKGNISAKLAPTLVEFFQNLNAVMGRTSELADEVSGKFKKFQEKHDPEGTVTRNAGNAAAFATGFKLLRAPSIYAKGVGATIILVTGINDLGKFLRGQPSTIGDIKDKTGGLLKQGQEMYDGIRSDLSNELMKTKEQQEIDRQDMLKGKPGVFGRSPNDPSYGQGDRTSSIINNNEFNIHSNGDPREVAEEVISSLQDRQWRSDQINQLFQASGMNA